MNFITPYQREKEYKKRAEERLKEHQFTLLVDTEEVQIYRCSRPNTIVYSFDIVLAPNCIAISGDIGRVGRVLYGVGKGLGFLANYGCSDYGFEKLDSAYFERKEISGYLVADCFYRTIYEHFGLEEIEEPPQDLKKPSDVKSGELYAALRELKRTLQIYHDANGWEELPEWLQGISLDDDPYYFKELLNELEQCNYKPSSEDELCRLMDEHGITERIELPEGDFTVHHSSVMWVTACAEYAAGRILEQQKKAHNNKNDTLII